MAFQTVVPIRTAALPPSLSTLRPSPTSPILPSRPRRPRRIHPTRSTPLRRPVISAASPDRLLWATNLTKSHDGRTFQLRDHSLTLHRGDKIAILGPNGAGKSTLFSILAGEISPDSGLVEIRKGITVALVAQSLPSDLSLQLSVVDAVLQLAARYAPTPPVRAALRHAIALAAVDQHPSDHSLAELAAATAGMDADPAAWQVSSYLSTALQRLELSPSAILATLSGGQKRRVAIAAALVSRPDVLLLDEVTNHLSIDGIQFLEEVLSDPSLTILCISHDRYFVDAVCTTAIWELDSDLRRFPPGYTAYLAEKDALLEQEARDTANMRKALQKELEWLRKQPKARGTKSRARTEDALRMQEELRERVTRDSSRTQQVRSLSAPKARLGGSIVDMKDVTIHRGDVTVVKNFSYSFERGERVGICGGNGVGKSSFLRAIIGEVGVTEGSIDVGGTIVFGHFEQEGVDIATTLSDAAASILAARGGDEVRVLDYVSELVSRYGKGDASPSGISTRSTANKTGDDASDRITKELERLSYSVTGLATQRTGTETTNPLMKMSAVTMLDHFGFSRDKQYALVENLSGGEKRRLQLMQLLLKNPNFLLLDEVSNDLDVNTLTMLEEVLVQYTGVLVLCSHDRFMLDRLVDHLLVLEGGGEVRLVEGKFTDYLAAKKELEMEEKRSRKAEAVEVGEERRKEARESERKKSSRKLSYKERKEYEGLEDEIDKCQAECERLTKLLETEAASAGYERVTEWSETLAQLEGDVERKTERWMELAELAGI